MQPPVLLHPDLLARHAQENPPAPRPLLLGRHRRQGGPVLVALHPRCGCLARGR